TDEPLFAFAGIYDAWKGENDDVVASYTIVTTQANDRMASIHERMPVIIRQEDEEDWLDRSVADAAQIERLLLPYPGEAMTITPVSKLVNNVRNDGPELIEPSTEES
ncbi:MAG: SOS response-associated peptidase family protein, partial [Thermomicrobiales bacterium]|nr:SOS response-associated peptidase family protein [Thermomicrobiales bacterium]